MVTLTEKAVDKVREIIAAREDSENVALRLYVKGGGCSGLSYGLALDYVKDDDTVIEMDGVKVLVDPEAAHFVQGSEIDYKEALMGGGFAINNPNAIRTCGCGSSFRTADEQAETQDFC